MLTVAAMTTSAISARRRESDDRESIDLDRDERRHQQDGDLEVVVEDVLHRRDEEEIGDLQEGEEEVVAGRAEAATQRAHDADAADDQDGDAAGIDGGELKVRRGADEAHSEGDGETVREHPVDRRLRETVGEEVVAPQPLPGDARGMRRREVNAGGARTSLRRRRSTSSRARCRPRRGRACARRARAAA